MMRVTKWANLFGKYPSTYSGRGHFYLLLVGIRSKMSADLMNVSLLPLSYSQPLFGAETQEYKLSL